MILPILILLVALVAVVIALVLRGRRSQRGGSDHGERGPKDPFDTADQDTLRGDPRSLTAGDIVEVRGMSYTVRGTLRLSEGSWRWSEHLLDDAKGTQVWLGVEEDPDLVLTQWTPVETEVPTPGPAKLGFGEREFRSEESGTARFRSEATTGLDESGSVRYHDYEASDGTMLGFESFDGADWEATLGEELTRYDVRIYPASA
ncbi:hypothetical protein J2S53_003644 [Actinopolyspora lacussalsi]|nr:hypothetical protein [Actinopolyspora lacussalsi]